MRRQTRTLLLAGVSFFVLGGMSHAGEHASEPIVIAQADTGAVAAAEQAVAEARAALETAKTAGKGVKRAQTSLDEALAQLEQAQAAAMPPAPPPEDVVEELNDAPPAEEPAANPPAEDVVKEPALKPPANDVAKEPAPKPSAEDIVQEPAPKSPAEDVVQEPAPKPPAEDVVQEPAPKPAAEDVAEEPAPKPRPKDVAKEPAPKPAAEDVVEEPTPKPPAEDIVQEPAPKPPAKDIAREPAPRPGPKAAEKEPRPDEKAKAKQASKAKKPQGDGPRQGPPPQTAEKPAEKPAKPLPESADAIKEGQKVQATDGRTIERERGHVVIRHEDEERFRTDDSRFDRRRGENDQTIITVERPNGDTIVTVRDADGDIVRRTKLTRDGREIVLIDDERHDLRAEGPRRDLGNVLPPIVLNIPRQDYIVESRRASPQFLYETLAAPPVERVDRAYTLDEVRYNERVRDIVRRVDVDTVTFDFGQAYVPEGQIDELDGIARAMQAAIDRNEREVFLIEGHTDAVGSDLANLALSDRRAESVAEILTYYYDIPPENLITQGYGESDLKVPTQEAERENRRVTVRRITPLLNAGT